MWDPCDASARIDLSRRGIQPARDLPYHKCKLRVSYTSRHSDQGVSSRRPIRAVSSRSGWSREDNSNEVTKNVTGNLKNVLRVASDGDGDGTRKSHDSDHSHVHPAHDGDEPVSRYCGADAAHGSIGNDPDDSECVPPMQVRKALRTMFPLESFPAEADDDPNHAEEVNQDWDAAEPTDVGPDMSENPPVSTNLSAVAPELVRKTCVNLGHPLRVWFPRVLRAASARLEVLANVRHQVQRAICSSALRPSGNRRSHVRVQQPP